MKFIKDSLTSITTQFALTVASMLTGIMTARLLGPEGKGAFTLIRLGYVMLVVLGCIGVQQSIVYFIGKRQFPLSKILANAIGLALASGLIIAIIFGAFVDYWRPLFFKDIKKSYVLILIGLTPIGILSTYLRHILLGQNRITLYNLLSSVNPCLLLILFTITWLAFKLTLLTAVLMWSISSLISALMILPFIAKVAPIRLAFNLKFFKEAVKFGYKTQLTGLAGFFNLRLDSFIVGYFLGLADVGYYSIAVVITQLIWKIPNATSLVLFPRVASASNLEANQISPKVCRNTLAIILFLSFGLLLFGRFFIVLLFGTQYLPAVNPLFILLPGTVASSISRVLSNDLIGRGRPELGMYAAFLSLVATIILDFTLIPSLGVSGAALASTVAYSLGASAMLYFFVRISGNSFRDTLIIKTSDLHTYLNLCRRLRHRLAS